MSTHPLTLLPGPIFIWLYFATIVTTAFYGFTCMQTFFYYVHYRNDPLHLNIFVAVIWAMNTIQEALTVAGAYKYIAAGLQNSLSLFNWVPELNLQIIPTALVAVLTQGLLMHRIYVFSGKNITILFLWLVLSIIQLVSSIIFVGKSLYITNGSLQVVDVILLNDRTFKTMLTLSLSIAAGEDILIAVFLVFLLLRQRPATAIATTAHMLQRLTVIAVNTGTWTAMFALLSVVFLYVLPSKNLYSLFAFPLCSVYCNTVLANLNTRAYLRDGSQAHLFFPPPEAARKTTESTVFSDKLGSRVSESV